MGSQNRSPVKIGLALGGGGARGYAHFGVLFALEKMGVHIDCVAGTSMGAAVGALWATDQHLDCYKELLKLSKSGVREYLDPEIPIVSGILKGDKLFTLLESWFKGYRIEHLSKEFRANAVELETGMEITFTEGSLACAVRASVSLPVILTPWEIDGKHYLDGGVTNPLPVRQCLEMGADYVIAVDLLSSTGLKSGSMHSQTKGHDIFPLHGDLAKIAGELPVLRKLLEPVMPEIAFSAVLISQKALTESNLRRWKPSFIIQPGVGEYTGGEFHLAEEISLLGTEAAEEALPEILSVLDKTGSL